MEIETTLDEWTIQVPGGAGKWEKVIAPFLRTTLAADMPGVAWSTGNIAFSPSEAMMSVLTTGRRPVHEVFHITMAELPGHIVLVDAEDYGKNLLVSWKLVFNAHKMPLWRSFAQYQGWMDAKTLTPYKRQKLASFKTITQEALKKAVQNFGNELDEDFSEEDEKSRGIETIDIL